MSKLNRLLAGAVCASALLASTGCGRRLPAADPCADVAAKAIFARATAAAPDCGEQPPAEPGAPAPGPGAPAPGPGAPAPGPDPGAPAPGPGAPAPGPVPPPINNPPAPPVSPPPTQAPPPSSPPPSEKPPEKPDPKPTPTPTPKPEEVFLKKMGDIGFAHQKSAVAKIQEVVRLRPVDWSKGKYDHPDKNVEAVFKATQFMFKTPPKSVEEYYVRSMDFAQKTFEGDLVYYVDLKTSAERGEFYILRFDPKTTQIVGVKENDVAYEPILSASSAQVQSQAAYRSMAAGDGKIFFYAEERGVYIKSDRFMQIPRSLLSPNWEVVLETKRLSSQAYGAYNAYQAPYYR